MMHGYNEFRNPESITEVIISYGERVSWSTGDLTDLGFAGQT